MHQRRECCAGTMILHTCVCLFVSLCVCVYVSRRLGKVCLKKAKERVARSLPLHMQMSESAISCSLSFPLSCMLVQDCASASVALSHCHMHCQHLDITVLITLGSSNQLLPLYPIPTTTQDRVNDALGRCHIRCQQLDTTVFTTLGSSNQLLSLFTSCSDNHAGQRQ